MVFLSIIVLISILVIYKLSKGKYDELIYTLDKKEYPLKIFIPLGLYVMEALKYRYDTKYDRNLYIRLSELYGIKSANDYLKIYWANKIVYLLIAFLLISLIGSGIDELNSGFIFIIIAILGAILYGPDRDLNEKVKSKYRMIRIDFPDFLNKLTLLIDAGMNIQRAWGKIVTDNKSNRPLYNELEIVWRDIRGGKADAEAYENFARRCKTPEISKFVSVILQNLRKGNTQLVTMLRVQGSDCWEMRKNEAKRLGEEASSKLLFPMMIMLIAILLIVLTPAVLQLRGFY